MQPSPIFSSAFLFPQGHLPLLLIIRIFFADLLRTVSPSLHCEGWYGWVRQQSIVFIEALRQILVCKYLSCFAPLMGLGSPNQVENFMVHTLLLTLARRKSGNISLPRRRFLQSPPSSFFPKRVWLSVARWLEPVCGSRTKTSQK
jgi:hypothetical protein